VGRTSAVGIEVCEVGRGLISIGPPVEMTKHNKTYINSFTEDREESKRIRKDKEFWFDYCFTPAP
jgi:hypothetical protein